MIINDKNGEWGFSPPLPSFSFLLKMSPLFRSLRLLCPSYSSPLFRFSSCFCSASSNFFSISPEVCDALGMGRAVVALESTVITHGLPYPTNLEVGLRLESIIREQGAIPATIALQDGQIRVGLGRDQLKRIASPQSGAVKVSRRDLANCLVQKKIGGTTVAASMWAAHKAGIRVFATGGIGGVHRDGENSMDISADLTELAHTPVAVVCAGAKSILDIGRTLEYLETQSVNVVVFDQHPHFPGFFSPRTQFKAPHHSDSLPEIADILFLSSLLGLPNGTLVACPPPIGEHSDEDGQRIEKTIGEALEEAKEARITGKELSPFILRAVNQKTGSASLKANIALLENNARIGARLAVHLSEKVRTNGSGPITMPKAKEPKEETRRKKERRGKKHPKIVCAGASIVDVQVLLPSSASSAPSGSGAYLPARIVHSPGGVARNHADALTRLGARSTLLSPIGQDLFGRFLEDKCAHMNWSEVLRLSDAITASSVGICIDGSSTVSQGFIAVDGIMARMDEEYIESKGEIIAEADYVLMDANLDIRIIRKLLQIVELSGGKVWFEPTNWLKVSKLFEALGPNALQKLAVISPNLNELEVLVKELKDEGSEKFVRDLKVNLSASPLDPNAIGSWLTGAKIPEALFPRSMSHLVITCDSKGVILISHPSPSSSSSSINAQFVPPPEIRPDQIVSVSGAGDCFNCGFLSAMLGGLSLAEAAEVARNCARASLCSAEVVPAEIEQFRRF